MSDLPKDPVILLSYVNTQLRDNYNTLDEMCKSFSVSKAELVARLQKIHYEYDEKQNQFI